MQCQNTRLQISSKYKSKILVFLQDYATVEDKPLLTSCYLERHAQSAVLQGYLLVTANSGVSASHIRFNLVLWLKRCLLKSPHRALRSSCHPDIAFLVAKTYKWEHEILLQLAVPARPAGLPHCAQLELI